MTRIKFAILAAVIFSGCQYQGQQAVDPFWGRKTVPPPPTGAVGTACPPTVTLPSTPSTMVPGGTLQTTPQPNLLPAPASTAPAGPTTPYIPPSAPPAAPYVPPSSTPAGTPYGYNTPAVTGPPSAVGPAAAPPSGYSGGASPYSVPPAAAGSYGSPPAATYGVPPGGYGSSGATPAAPASPAPTVGSPPPTGPASGSPAAPTSPSPTGTPPASPSPRPDYLPPDGSMNFPNNNSSSVNRPQGNWVSSGGGATTSVGFDGATISAPPGTSGAGVDTSPSVVRIPNSADTSGMVAPASATIPDR